MPNGGRKKKGNYFTQILITELIPALGCTEPIAVALAASKAGEVLGKLPEKVELQCSGNIIKNVKGVIVPNSNGRTGLEIAAAMGFASGCSDKGLEVLEGLTSEQLQSAEGLVEHDIIRVKVAVGVDTLYVRVRAKAEGDEVEVILKNSHNHIASIKKNGIVLYEDPPIFTSTSDLDKSVLSMPTILNFARTVDFTEYPELVKVLEQQIKWNTAISDEGLKGNWGAQVGKTILLSSHIEDTAARAKARAAAGSDARMNGCCLPVIINSGSGNQGMTVSLPVIEYARDLGANRETLYRALIVSNLIAIYQKNYIGKLSAFCGAVSAAAGAGAGIAFLKGMDDVTIGMIVTNTIGTIGGMVCDGAKRSCAAKVAMAVETALMGIRMAEQGQSFNFGEGIIGEDVDSTIRNVGRMAKDGMRETDIEILHIMTED
ncbi:MAG TPA: L-serine ammonia-lyase, iron-sulfur-dependent, subunit alpha [Anaerolineaceae bacterium]|nr:L-serine ammonia-lyase, iron-sulfur-dependent, subunit alpha [Anaerolineaceae bacterium]